MFICFFAHHLLSIFKEPSLPVYISLTFFCISSNQFRLELFVYDIWPSIQSIGIGRIRLFFYWPFIVLNIKRYDLLWFWPNWCCCFTDRLRKTQQILHLSLFLSMFIFHFKTTLTQSLNAIGYNPNRFQLKTAKKRERETNMKTRNNNRKSNNILVGEWEPKQRLQRNQT